VYLGDDIVRDGGLMRGSEVVNPRSLMKDSQEVGYSRRESQSFTGGARTKSYQRRSGFS
jgi:hypothetical protein